MIESVNLKKITLTFVIIISLAFSLAGCNPSLVQLNSKNEGTNVGLLLPYGSKIRGDETLAISLENAARLAVNDLGYKKIRLLVYATEGNPKIASQAARKAVADGAEIILGPLRSDVANSAAVAIAKEKINVLTFSNNTAIAGRNLFLLGTSFDTIANRLTRYANKVKSRKWLLVYPKTKEGEVARDSIISAAEKNDISIVETISFELTTEGVIEAIPEIASLAETSKVNTIMLTSNSAGALPLLGQLLPEKGIDPKQIQYAGLSRWDVSKQTLRLPGLQGGWFVLPDPFLTEQFNTRYKTIFSQTPHPLASLAYDGIAAIGALQKEGKDMSSKSLNYSPGFLGVNGLFRFTKKGANVRALSIATIKKSQVIVIDPAPKSFTP